MVRRVCSDLARGLSAPNTCLALAAMYWGSSSCALLARILCLEAGTLQIEFWRCR